MFELDLSDLLGVRLVLGLKPFIELSLKVHSFLSHLCFELFDLKIEISDLLFELTDPAL